MNDDDDGSGPGKRYVAEDDVILFKKFLSK